MRTTREFPITFRSDEIRAILAGHKTATRRVIEPQPPYDARQFFTVKSNLHPGCPPGFYYWTGDCDWTTHRLDQCPDWRIGDRLWVRETVKLMEIRMSRMSPPGSGMPVICYKADRPDEYWTSIDYEMREESFINWTPPSRMPKWAARIFLEITDLGIGRLNSMNICDIIKEGWVPPKPCSKLTAAEEVPGFEWWMDTWQRTNHALTWSDSRVVRVIEFKLLDVREPNFSIGRRVHGSTKYQKGGFPQ